VDLVAGCLAQPADSPDFPKFVVLMLGGIPMVVGWIVAIARVGLTRTLGRAATCLLGGLLVVFAAHLAGGQELAPIGALILGAPACWALAIYLAATPA
jgi:hypothetical protein